MSDKSNRFQLTPPLEPADRSDRGARVLLAVLRAVSSMLLFLGGYLYLQGSVSIWFVGTAFILTLGTAIWFEKSGFRFLPAVVLFTAVVVLVRPAFFLLFTAGVSNTVNPGVDFLFFFFDRNYYPLILPVAVVWVLYFAGSRYSGFVRWESGIRACLLVLLAWPQGEYRLSLFPNSGLLFLSASGFVVLEVTILLLHRRIYSPGGKSPAKTYVWFATLLIPLLIVWLLFLLGRYSEGAVSEGGGLMRPTFFRFDFSKFVRLESEISMSDDLVMLFRKAGPSDRLLLRRYVLGGYRPGSGFLYEPRPGDDSILMTVPDGRRIIDDPGYQGREVVDQEYFLINFDPSSLVAINYPIQVVPMRNWDASSFLRIYTVRSKVGSFMPWELIDAPPVDLTSEDQRYYTEYGEDEIIRRTALDLTEDLETQFEKVDSIRAFLQDNYYYSLKPGIAPDGNQLHHFLYEGRRGYCSYFAFSMALMCRSIGIPARVAVGFYVDPNLEVLNFYPVRADMAHAWVEVYFAEYGWIEFDPTSNTLAPGEEYEFGQLEVQEFATLIEEIIDNQDDLEEEEALEERELDRREIRHLFSRGFSFLSRFWFVVLPGLYLCGVMLVKGYHPLLALLFRDGRRRVKHTYTASLQTLAGVGWSRGRDESYLEFARRLEETRGILLVEWTRSYLEAAFAPAFSDHRYEAARQALSAYRASFRKAVPLWLRMLGFLNPVGSLRRR